MSKFFISYRHIDPDQQMAKFLQKYLEEKGHEVFIDTGVQMGVKRVEEIERYIKSAESYVVLLSKNSIRSDMVRQEIKLAYQLSVKRNGRYKILPVRVDFAGALPYDLATYLEPTRYLNWIEGMDFAGTAGQLAATIADLEGQSSSEKPGIKEVSGPDIKRLFYATEAEGAPLPTADPRFWTKVKLETSTIKLDSPFYLKREIDDEVMEQVRKQGTTTIINAPRQMGKSSLLMHTHSLFNTDGFKSCFVDFKFLNNSHLNDLNTLFRYIAFKLAKAFNTRAKPDAIWNVNLEPAVNLIGFLREAVLNEIDLPVLIVFDEVDRLFNQPYRDEFFSTVRMWHNLRTQEKCWTKLNIAIAHTTEPYLWIKDMNQSPFNVGLRLKMKDFDLLQLEQLNELYGAPLGGKGEMEELLDLIGGQPFLTRVALYEMVKKNYSFSLLMKLCLEERGPFADHLQRLLWLIHTDNGLKVSLQQVLRHKNCEFETHFIRLRSAGLVLGNDRNNIRIRCKLYEDFFKKWAAYIPD